MDEEGVGGKPKEVSEENGHVLAPVKLAFSEPRLYRTPVTDCRQIDRKARIKMPVPAPSARTPGSVFVPDRHTRDTPPVAASPGDPAAWRGEGTLLVIDDDDIVRTVTARMLQRSGFEVLTAPDGAAGVEVFRDNAGAIRVVILDMTMPRMDGHETFRALQDVDATVRVVLSSGYAEQDAASIFSVAELAGFIQKPYTAEELIATVRTVLGS